MLYYIDFSLSILCWSSIQANTHTFEQRYVVDKTPPVSGRSRCSVAVLSTTLVPSHPASWHHSPYHHFATLEVTDLEALFPHLGFLPLFFTALLPSTNLFLGAIPINHYRHMVWLTNIHAVLGVKASLMASEPGIAEGHDITGPYLIELLCRCIP